MKRTVGSGLNAVSKMRNKFLRKRKKKKNKVIDLSKIHDSQTNLLYRSKQENKIQKILKGIDPILKLKIKNFIKEKGLKNISQIQHCKSIPITKKLLMHLI